MAKRKSLNKRRSRYSSAILNSDTEIFDDEYPYWWKKLEDTSLAQLSTDSKILSQTSRHLNSNSQIETSQVTGEWWKVLDVSSIPNSPKINKDIVEKNSANNVLMSESEEEPEIAKSKHHLRSKARKSQDNIFVSALNDSVTTKSDIKKKNNVITSESEEEPEIAKSKHHLRSKARKSQDNIFLSALNDSVTTKSDIKKKDNVITSESDKETEIAKKRYPLHSKATQSKDNIFLSALNDSVTTKSDIKKKNNVITSESDKEPEIAKSKHHLRSKARKSQDNIFLSALNDSVTTKSDIKKKNNVITSESEEEPEIAKSKHHLRSKARKSQDNIFLSALNDSVTTKSDIKKKNNVITSESEEEPEIAKKRYPLHSKATQSKDNIFLNVLNDSVTTKSDIKEKNNVITSESEEEPEIAKKRYPLHSKATQSKDNIFLNVLNDSVTTMSEDIQKNNNIITSESEGKERKRKFPLRSKATESKDNISSNVADDFIITKSDAKKKNNNVVTTKSAEGSKIAKQKNLLQLRAKRSKDNVFLNALSDSVTTTSEIIEKNNNVATSESEGEPKIAKKRYPVRLTTQQSKDNIFLNALSDSGTTKSEVIEKNNNVATSESEGEPEIAKRKFPLRSKATESKDNIFSNVLNDSVRSKSGTIHESNDAPISESEESKTAKINYSLRRLATKSKEKPASNILNDSVTTTSGIVQKTNNVPTSVSEESKIAKRPDTLHSMATESKDNTASNISNESVTTTSGIVQKTNNAPTSVSEESKIAKEKYLLRSKAKKSKDNSSSKVLDDSMTTKLKVMQRTREKSSKSNSASNNETVPNVEQLNKIQEYNLNHSQKTDDISKLKSNISKNENNELQMTTNYLVPAITETSVSSELGSNRFASNFEDDCSIHFTIPKAQSTVLEGSSLSVHSNTKENNNSDAYHKISKWKSKLLTNHKWNAKKNLFETVFEDQESTIKIQGNATADGVAERSPQSSKVSETLHPSQLPLSPSKKAISSPSRHSTMVKTFTNTHSDEPKGQRSIRHFLMSDKTLPASQVFWDKVKVDGIKRELERVKEREIARMKMDRNKQEVQKKLPSREGKIKEIEKNTKSTSQKQRSMKQIHKAFLVNGRAYRAPRLPRPQPWITDRLYKYLWKRMEPKFKLETRVVSEKFIRQLSSVTTLIARRKSYINYKAELYALMKEMARLDIIHTRNDFYNFCHDFFPYELRVKTVPMLLPGNKRNIPYNADKLHEPLLVP